MEFFRAKDDRFVGPFTLAQTVSVALIVVGVTLLMRWWQPAQFSLPRETAVLRRQETGATK